MFDIEQNYKTSRMIAAQGMVLVKNEEETLPFSQEDSVGIIGKECLNLIKGGGGSARVKCAYVKTFSDGLFEKEAEGKIKLCQESFDLAKEGIYDLEALNRIASQCNKVVLTYQRFGTEGEDRILGEKASRYHCDFEEEDVKEAIPYYPTCAEIKLLNLIEESNIQSVVLICNIASAVDLSFIEEYPKIKAVLISYLPGMECGTSISDVLTGDINPSGRLVDTFARSYDDYPSSAYYDKNPRLSEYKEGIFVGYRYFETYAKDKVLYPFGYGLSYTDFAFENTKICLRDQDIKVMVTVRNIGKRVGREVVQIYVSAPKGKLEKPALELKGFAKTENLAPGEAMTVEVHLPIRDLASFDDTGITGYLGAWVLEKGEYKIVAGKSIRDTVDAGTYNVEETYVVEQDQIRFDGSEYVYTPKFSEKEGNGVVKYTLYDVASGKATMEQFVDQMTVEELTSFALGQPVAFLLGTSGIGNMKKYGVPNPQTADGPAGIRRAVNTTCFPCGILVASSWDPEIQYEMGCALGYEGVSTGLDVILGPAMNIHRDPLGGRCFEYYSEDPLIAGKTAAAIVKGIQNEGLCATLKHFALNSCEYFRNVNNSVATERTIREIYVRGFEIAVKESNPAYIMTSYNIVNGKHASANAQLLRGIVRDEWKYEGAFMTDWRNGVPLVDEMWAGNNIKMPLGYPDEGMKVIAAYKAGKMPLSIIKENAAYVLRSVMKTRSFRERDFGVIHTLNGDHFDLPVFEVNGLSSYRILPGEKEDGTPYLYQLNLEQRNQRSYIFYVLKVKKGGKFRVSCEISTNRPETEIWFDDGDENRLGVACCHEAVDETKWYTVSTEVELKAGENMLKVTFANEPDHDYEFFCPSTEIPNEWPEPAKYDIRLSKMTFDRT